jgi:hypothetical protein
LKTEKKWRAGFILLTAGFILAITSCATGPAPYPLVNNSKLKTAEYESPETHTIVYGFISREGGIFSSSQIPIIELAQIAPDGEPMFIYPGRQGSFFFTQPVPVGSAIHLLYYSYQEGRTIYYSRQGLQKGYDITAEVSKPGLHYAGTFVLTSPKRDGGMFEGPSGFGFQPVKEDYEAEALQLLLKKLKKSEWEGIIEARLKELTNE